MSFTNPYPTPNKERIIGEAWIFNNTLGGGEGKIITIANYKFVKGVFGMKVGSSGIGKRRGIGKKRGGCIGVGFKLDRFLDDKEKGIVGFGLIVE